MDIKEIALKVADSLRNKVDGISHMQSNQGLVAFAEALISAYKAELLKEVGEPFGFYYEINGTWDAFVVGETEPDDDVYDEGSLKALFTSDQVAAAIVKATKPLEYQLAKAEQRVAEACAKWIDGYAGIHQKEMLSDTAKSFADALRRGEWRKFVKEV